MPQNIPPYAQDPRLPHPGTVKLLYLWNGSEKTRLASEWSESMVFHCVNAEGGGTSREDAAWCVPIVEYETFSVDDKGNPVEPRLADFIRIDAYGPNHTLIESTVTPPRFRPPPEAKPESASTLQQAASSVSPQAMGDGPAGGDTSEGREKRLDESASASLPRLTWWQRVRRALFGQP